jgi:hypothetical protein
MFWIQAMISALTGIGKSRMTIGEFLEQRVYNSPRICLVVDAVVHERNG